MRGSRVGRVLRGLYRSTTIIDAAGASTEPGWDAIDTGQFSAVRRDELERACRGRAQSAYLGDNVAVARVLGRYKLFVDSRDRGFAPHLLLDGFWEIWLTQFIARALAPGAGVIDVGANYGYFSVLMADLVGPSGHVLCVEPNPPAFAALQQSLSLNGVAGHTSASMAAAGASTGPGFLFVPEGEPKNATLVSEAMAAHLPQDGMVAVPVIALDELWNSDRRLDFVKIDAEGAEEDVIAGMAGLIERWRPEIVLEFNPHRCRDASALLERLMASYGQLRIVDGAGEASPLTRERALTLDDRDDRLLFFSSRR